MTSTPLTATRHILPECGAAVAGGREACQRVFDDILVSEFGDLPYAACTG
jgi:hypothetical protein